MRILLPALVCFTLPVLSFAQETHPGVAAALKFIERIIEGENDAAYESASQKFRSVNSKEQFQHFVSQMNAGELTSFEVTKATASQDGSSVTVNGKGKNKDGKGRQVTMGAVREGESYGMSFFRVRSFGTSAPPPINDPEASLTLAKSTLQRLAACLESGNFDPYLAEIAMIHRQTLGDQMLVGIVRQLNETRYGPVSGMIDRLQPGRPATMSGDLARYHFVVDYPESKRRLLLEFVSLWSEPNSDPWPNRWQLQFYDPDTAVTEPSKEEITILAREAVTGLLSGLREGNIEPFYSEAGPFFREVVTLQSFKDSFPAFTRNQVDYSAWRPQEAEVLSTKLAGTVGKSLTVEISIPTPTDPAYATLTFLKENETWDFSGINFHSKSPEERSPEPAR